MTDDAFMSPRSTPASLFVVLALLCAFTATLLLGTGCKEDELQPTEPEGAFGLLTKALQERDEDGVWEYLGKDTRALFTDHYRLLVRIDRIIEAYFDPAEHRDMRERTGVYILEQASIATPKDLYHYIFDMSRTHVVDGEEVPVFEFGADQEVGMTISEVEYLNEEETSVRITTRGEQKFILHREEDGVWRTDSLGDFFQKALEPIATSEANLRQYAEENLREERERRKALAAFFYERTGRTPPPRQQPAAPPAEQQATAPTEGP